MQGLVDLATSQHAHKLTVFNNWKALVAVSCHHGCGFGHSVGWIQGAHAIGHDLANRGGWPDVLVQGGEQLVANLGQVDVTDERGRGPRMPTSAKVSGDGSYINGIGGGAGDELGMIVHGHDQEESIRFE